MTAQPLVSIIIPVYNTEPYLRCCLDSILAQTYGNFELLLVDDGSTDASPEICDAYAQKDPRVRAFHQKNAGQAAARNVGLDNMRGAYVVFVDSDDFVHREYLAQLLRPCLEQGAEVTIGQSAMFYPDEPQTELPERELPPAEITCMTGREASGRFFVQGDLIKTVCLTIKLIRADLLDGVRIPNLRVHEDRAVTWRLFYPLTKVAFTNSALYFIRVNPTSIMHSKFTDDFFSVLSILEEQIRFYLEHDEHKLAAAATDYLCWAIMDLYDKTLWAGGDMAARKRVLRRATIRLCKYSFAIRGVKWKRRVKYILALLVPKIICPICHPSDSLKNSSPAQ